MHSQSIIKYITQAGKTLFSKNSINIAGSSFLVQSMMTLIVYFLGVYLLYSGAQIIVSLDGVEIIRFFIQGYIILLVMIISVLIARGWQAIVIPIRAIDHTRGLHFRGDIRLFHEHFGKYISFFFWYSSILFLLWNAIFFGNVLLWALHPNLGILGVLCSAGVLIRVSTLYSASWYHMLSEDSGSFDTFSESKKYIRGRIVEVFLKILGVSFAIWIMSLAIEFFLFGFLSDPLWSSAMSNILSIIRDEGMPIIERMKQIILTLESSYGQVSLLGIIASLIYSLGAVIARAMYHIFAVHYYLHLRNEWVEEKK